MRRIVLIFIAVATVLGVTGIYFGLKVWKAVKPVVGKPPEDIVEIIECKPDKSTEVAPFPLQLPKGFSIYLFAKDLAGPRVIKFSPGGWLVVSETGAGRVTALKDENGDGFAETRLTVIDGLDRPHGISFFDKYIYVAEPSILRRYEFNPQTGKAKVPGEKILDLPSDEGHFTRTIDIGPDPSAMNSGQVKLFISIGSSCNVCRENDELRATIMVSDPDGKNARIFAKGLRNTVSFKLHPITGEWWGVDMGRDWLGDNTPPDEINIIKDGKNYGWPICYGKNIHDANFDKNTYFRNPCMEPFETPSYIDIPAHSAPLGLDFFSREWPEEYQDDLLVAYHGSWNRSTPTGYKVVRYELDAQGKYLGEEDFLIGFLSKDGALGRPVDILIQPFGKVRAASPSNPYNGTILISDDKAGVIYRIVHQ